MIGAGIDGLNCSDTSDAGTQVQGQQCLQVSGYDNFELDHFDCRGMDGACLIWGGYNLPAASQRTVRESDADHVYIYDSGKWQVGDAAVQITGPALSGTFDEPNQIGFNHLHVVCPNAEALAVSTNNVTNQGTTTAPRLIWISGADSQLEACGHKSNTYGTEDLPAPTNLVDLVDFHDVKFDGTELNGSKPGGALIKMGTAGRVTFTNGSLRVAGLTKTYTVGETTGSAVLSYQSGGMGGFNATGAWDGWTAQLVDGAGCTVAVPCNVVFPQSAVSTNGQSLTTGYTGTTTTNTAQLTITGDGYYFHPGVFGGHIYARYNDWTDQSAATLAQYGMSSSAVGVFPGMYMGTYELDRGDSITIQVPYQFAATVAFQYADTHPVGLQLNTTGTQPTCSATYRYQAWIVPGNGTSTADTLQICTRSSTGTYSWVTH